MEQTSNGGGFFSGLLQTVATTATGYLDRRIDIDLERRLARATEPRMTSDQTPIAQSVPNQMFGGSMLLPLLAVGLVAVLVLKS